MPPASTRSSLTDTSSESRTHIAATAPVEDSQHTSSSLHMFNYMKTLNKVVNASKKKGRQVMEKMTVTTGSGSNKDAIISELQKRLVKLDKKNNKLVRENESLREGNDRLELENKELKLAERSCDDGYLSTPFCDVEDDDDNASVKSDDDPGDDVSDEDTQNPMQMKEESLGDCHDGNDDGYNAKQTYSSEERRFSPKNTFDDPFFQHMAHMNGEEANRWDKPSPGELKQSHTQNRCAETHAPSFSDDNDENASEWKGSGEASRSPEQLFDSPLELIVTAVIPP
jgi:cell division protein FtsB